MNIVKKITSNNFTNYILFSVFIYYFYIQYLNPSIYPGDTGDTKAFIAIMHNFYLAIKEPYFSFTETNYFYPYIKSIFFSETYWGFGALYYLFFELNFDSIISYKIIFTLIFLVNFICFFYFCKILRISNFASLFATSIFVFSLPIIAQETKAAFLFRGLAPICALFLFRFLGSKKNKYIFFYTLAFSVQIFLNVQTAIWILYFSFFIFLIHLIKINNKNKYLKNIMINFFKYKNFLLILVTSILFVIITIYIYQYIQVGNDYNFSRMRGYNYKILINIFSFIATERSNLWPKGLIPEGYPMSNQQLYLGWGINILLIIFFLKRKILSQDVKFIRFFKLSIYPCLLVSSIGPISFYFFLEPFPPFSSIRSVSRYILIMLFPLSILIALGMDKLIKINKNYKFYFSVLFLIFLFETGTADKVRTNIENENNRLKTLEEKIKIIPKGKIVVVNNEIIQGRFDILYLTAKYSLRSMNGNSSFIPGNIIPINSCKKVNSGLLYAFETMKQNKINFKKPSQEEFIFIDFPNNCKLEINNL